LFLSIPEGVMKISMCECPTCGWGLDIVLAWTRLVTDEPVELAYQGPWGLDASWPVGGAAEVSVTCPCCGIPSTVGRNCPSAAA
jgi:hypothetical protein